MNEKKASINRSLKGGSSPALRVGLALVIAMACVAAFSPASYASVAAGYSEYFVPGDDDDMMLVLETIGAGTQNNGSGMHSIISIVAGSPNTVVYYDHWENGYNLDKDDPAGTADEIVTLAGRGDSHIFESSNVPIPRTTSMTSCGGNPCYDGRDRIYVAGGATTVTRASWTEQAGTLLAIAWEVYPIRPQLTTYILPFGEDLYSSQTLRDFERVFALVQATADNTEVRVDINNDGVWDNLDWTRDGAADGTVRYLNKGDVFLVDRTSVMNATLPSGTKIVGNDTLQVQYVVGDQGSNYEARGFSAFPRGFWDTRYYAPVSGPAPSVGRNVDIYLHNPQDSAITITYETDAAQGNFNIAAHGTVSFNDTVGYYVPQNSAVYLRGTAPFWGVSSIDTAGHNESVGQTNDWGYSLVPAFMLDNEHFMGWAPGSDPVNYNAGSRDDSGIYVTAAQDNTVVFVDRNNDGTVDYQQTLNRLESWYVWDATDGDLSQANVWSTGPVAISYGQNPDTAAVAVPAIDVGYTTIPSKDMIELVLQVFKETDPVVLSTTAGDTADYTLTVNSYDFEVDGVSVVDTLPAGWAYVNNSTTIVRADKTNSTANPAISGGGLILTWSSAACGSMLPNQEITIHFTARNTTGRSNGEYTRNQVQATGTRSVGGVTQTFVTSDFVYNTYGDIRMSKETGGVDPLAPGDTYTYTVTVTNPASAPDTATGIAIYDQLPPGVTYVPGSSYVDLGDSSAVDTYFYDFESGNQGFTVGAAGGTPSMNWERGDPATITPADGGKCSSNCYGGGPDDAYSGSNCWATDLDDLYSNSIGGIYLYSPTYDFTGMTSVSLSYWEWLEIEGNAYDQARLQYSVGGGAWTDAWSFGDTGGAARLDSGWSQYTHDASAYAANQAQVQWRWMIETDGSWQWGGWYVDDVQVTASDAAASGVHVRDEFSTVAYSNNDGPDNWGGNWAETNDDNSANSGNILVTGGRLRLHSATRSISRSVDLSGQSSATLTYDYQMAGALEAEDHIEVFIESGGSQQLVAEYWGPASTTGSESITIPPAFIAADTTLRFQVSAQFYGGDEYFYADNVDIQAQALSSGLASDPPNFVSRSDGYSLAPGESLTLTFQVTVDDPLPTGVTDILNTAYLTTNEIPVPMHDHAYNLVVNPSTSSASVGDTVWLDVNADGVQQAGEMGLSNVEVTLKDEFGTPLAVTLTDSWGNYLFIGVAPGNDYYVDVTGGLPAGLVQSYPTTRTDNQTDPFDLVAGQIYLDADLGFTPAPGTVTIGDRVWSDYNGDEIQDAGEPGISGVTVTLYRDDGDGLFEPGGDDTLAATRVTAAGGFYLFTGVDPAYPDWYVMVDDTQAALTGYSPTTGTVAIVPGVSAGDVILNADFGFVNPTGTYQIKDRVWFDVDEDGNDDVSAGDNAEAGIYGVTVELLDQSGMVIAVAVTDASGTFTFSGLPGAGADYTLRISDTNGILNDYYGTTSWGISREFAVDNLSTSMDYTAEPGEPHFGYNLKGSIGDTIYNDVDGNGTQDAGEPGIGGVAVRVYHDVNGDGLLDGGDALEATLTTDVNGRYLFSALPDGDYIVSVPTPPGGTTYTSEGGGGDNDPATGSQQASTLAAGGVDLARDFGYQAVTPRTISGTVWNDSDVDGAIGGTEGLFSSVTVELWQGGARVAATTSNASGYYSFAGLVPGAYTVRLTDDTRILNDYDTVYEDTEGSGAASYNSQEAVDVTSASVSGVDFGYKKQAATYAALDSFSVTLQNGLVRAEWVTAAEVGCVGFLLLRDEGKGESVRLGGGLLPGMLNSRSGGTYLFIDDTALAGRTYTYTLVEVEAKGGRNVLGSATLALAATDPVASGGTLSVAEAYTRTPNAEPSAAVPVPARMAALTKAGASGSAGSGDTAAKAVLALFSSAVFTEEGATKAGEDNPDAVKILVDKTGVYTLTAAELAPLMGISEAGVKDLIVSGQLSMALTGLPVAWQAIDGGDGLVFYGLAPDSIYTAYNVYWLGKGQATPEQSDTGASKAFKDTGRNGCFLSSVIQVLALTAAVDEEPAFFRDSAHFEENHWDISNLFDDPGADFWVWDVLYAGFPGYDRKDFALRADGAVADADPVTLTVILHGASETAAAADHHVAVAVNGTQVGEAHFDGTVEVSFSFAFDPVLLQDGENTVTVTAILDGGVAYSVFYVESFDLSYDRSYTAWEDRLAFPGKGAESLGAGGFTSDEILVFDITNPLLPVPQQNLEVRDDGGSFSVHFSPQNPNGRFIAVAKNALLAPAFLETEVPSTLSAATNQADYLVIAPEALVDGAQGLADYRAGQGLSSMVVSLTDIMDEFNWGIFDPEALRDFLRTAYRTWEGPPRYVVLVGKGTSDYMDYQGYGDNLMPPLMVATPDGLYASDSKLSAVGEDELTRVLAVGRLPVVNAGQLNDMLVKIMGYEAGAAGDWAARVVMVADNADAAGDFPTDSDAVATLVPAPYQLRTIHLPAGATGAQVAATRNQLLSDLNYGALVMNYIGHGGWDRLANEQILGLSDVAGLTNGSRLPLVAAMTCIVGQSMPGFDTLSESLVLAPGGGAAAVFSPSGLSLNNEAVKLDKALMGAIFQDGKMVVGDAVVAAQNAFIPLSNWPFMVDIYNLYGDPALKLR